MNLGRKEETKQRKKRPLFGDAISSTFPLRFQDVSDIRQVPDHQEVFVDPARDESLIFELVDFKNDVGDNGSASRFLQDLAVGQYAEGSVIIEQSGVIEVPGLCYRNVPAIVTTAVGQMVLEIFSLFHLLVLDCIVESEHEDKLKAYYCIQLKMAISKGRQGREAQNIVRVYLANLRLKEVRTDVLITAYEPILINPLSESAGMVGAGFSIPAEQSGCIPMGEVFKLAVSSFKVNEWSLFGASPSA
ncbi:Ran-interacting Mog1 protein [Dillenia turbinata]|uniref:Ran-interacting Mog1 protein n=1 Tax=Dillenia turbinata TaxID=194707 RepID=A0AAN8UWJ4_9MAGN